MKSLHVGLLIGTLALVGCGRESPKGGPGAKDTPPASKDRDTFSVVVPKGATDVTQGKREEVTISLNRDGDFKQAVHLKFDVPKGLKVIPADVSIKTGETKTNVFIEAAEDAIVGPHSITVTGSPETGKPTSVKMEVDVKKKG